MSRDSETSSSTELQVLNPKSDQQGGAVMDPQPYSAVCKKKRLCCLLGTSFATVLTLLMVTLFVRTFTLKEVFVRRIIDPSPSKIDPDKEQMRKWAENLGKGIQIKTISFNETYQQPGSIEEIHRYISKTYPNIHTSDYISKTLINQKSLVYRVEGSIDTANPYMVCAHMDVVPPGDLSGWERDPFLGQIVTEDDGIDYVYGRGAIDTKHTLFGILEALDYGVVKGWRPRRTFYVAFGHDEEVSGHQGAAYIAEHIEEDLKNNGEKLDFILDEGLFVTQGVIPGTSEKMIMIGVTEKGSTFLDLEVSGEQGHSSIPPPESPLGILASAVSRLEKNPQPSRFGTSVESDLLTYAAPFANFGMRLVFANMWLFSPIVSKVMSGKQASDAMQRTTTALTIFNAGFKANVVPGKAKAVVNHRVHPFDNLETVLAHDRDIIDDERVKITVKSYTAPPAVSPYSNDNDAFQIVANAALDVYPDGHIVPGMLVGNTDTLHYVNLTTNIYRFSPAHLMPEDIPRFHGLNERISVTGYAKVVEFFHRLFATADVLVQPKYSKKRTTRSETTHVIEL